MKPYICRSIRLCLVLAWCIALVVGGKVLIAQTYLRSFSADQVRTAGKRVTTGKVYGNEKALRIETEHRGRKSILITRLDRKVVWSLMPDQKMYAEMSSLGKDEFASGLEGAKVEKQSLGTEQVGPYQCDKYRLQTTYEGHVYTSIEWNAKELNGFPVKRASEKGDWTVEYQNIKLGPQDPSLFEIPEGYKKLSTGGLVPNFQR